MNLAIKQPGVIGRLLHSFATTKACRECGLRKPFAQFDCRAGLSISRVCLDCIGRSVESSKRCTACQAVKPENQFYRRRGRLLARCKECHNKDASKWARANKEKRKIIFDRWMSKNKETVYLKACAKRFNTTPETIANLVKNQAGICAICKKPESEVMKTGRPKSLAVDHDHKTGMIRGLLCRRCNNFFLPLLELEGVSGVRTMIEMASSYMANHGGLKS